MQNTNKILCNMAQSLTDAEKYRARLNIGTHAIYAVQPSSETHIIGQTEASDGQFIFSRSGVSGPGLFLLSLHFYIDSAGTKPNENVIPVWVTVRRNKSGGGKNAVTGYTADITRLDQNGPWHGRFDIFQVVTDKLTAMDFIVNFEPYKIPQNTPVVCEVTGAMIGNVEPTP